MRPGHWHPTELCARFGISRKTGYKWWHRYERGGLAAIVDELRRPDTSPTALDAALGGLLLLTRQGIPPGSLASCWPIPPTGIRAMPAGPWRVP